MRDRIYKSLAGLVLYPEAGYRWQLAECRQLLAGVVPKAVEHLGQFEEATADLTTEQFEELFTHCFDHNPAHALEIGWHLFGEDYHRGALLVRLRQELRRHELAESVELPDHLTHVLALLGCMESEEALRFAHACVTPALGKLVEGLKKDETPYLDLAEALAAVLAYSTEHGFLDTDESNTTPDDSELTRPR
jgi:nitrate reductase molybdenum cofactor assembly chaperone